MLSLPSNKEIVIAILITVVICVGVGFLIGLLF